jgi:nucleoside phosphorylase
MVGIGGGVPSSQHDIRLGDVVVSKPVGELGGVVQYDFGKTVQQGHFVRQGAFNRPPTRLLSATSTLQTQLDLGHSYICGILARSAYRHPQREEACTFPGASRDQLFNFSYSHPAPNTTGNQCDRKHLVERAPRADTRPVVHYGLIASANQVMRDGATRERLRQELDVLCFEIEAAGLMDDFPCLVVRGICDYADSHKNKGWQDYAASTAAAFTKALLGVIAGDIYPPPNGKLWSHYVTQSVTELTILMGKALADAALSDNIDLSTKYELEDGVDNFWEHLTVSGFDLYRKIWERLPKTDGRYVQCKC